MTCSNCCGHNDHRPCVEYIPCVGPTGPAGPTATNQFLSLGAGAGTELTIARTAIQFNAINAQNGTDITATIPTTTITLAPNHSYYISYNVNTTATGIGELGAVLLLNGNPIDSSASNVSLLVAVAATASLAGGTIITVGSSASTLQLATTASIAGIFTLANAGISIIKLL
ncbi:hypothetical protein QJS64_20125 (plasmid) [Paraclostridium bifermentans]|uniref:BclA C-terminal domain-containing protein n=1 Tax=Paraclostridium bifermentans TaxID=1490 RepID=A0ABY8R9T6_PARBF|nr:hypothetical protein QJS64_20125 [Paraclostridium bifermentans]